MGLIVTGDGDPYRYLVQSIRTFPGPEAFSAMIARAGFKRVTHTAFSGNIAALHGAWKL
jgi:demethylmenaquinone methyltransferase/2-methoxy-6-polyprenyl-1,4-benzoquinol methylase